MLQVFHLSPVINRIGEIKKNYDNPLGCPKKIVPFSKIFLWAPDVIL